MDLYLLIERGKYDEYLNLIQEDHDLNRRENCFLQATYFVKTQDKEGFSDLQNKIANSPNHDPYENLILTVKSISFLIFEGEIQKIQEHIDSLQKELGTDQSFEELTMKLIQADFFQYIGIYYVMNTEIENAEIWFEKAITLAEENDIPFRISKIKNNYAILKADKGEIVKAQSFNFEVKEIWENNNSFHNLGQLYGNISELYELRGIYDSALHYAILAEEILKKIDNRIEHVLIKSVILQIIRKSTHEISEIAERNYNSLYRTLSTEKELLTNNLTAKILLELVIFDITYNIGNTEKILQLFEELAQTTNQSIYVMNRLNLANAIYKSESGRFKDKLVALELYSDMIADDHLDFIVKSMAIQFYIDVLIFEFLSTRHQDILDDISDILKDMEDWITNGNSIELEVKHSMMEIQLSTWRDQSLDVKNRLIDTMVYCIDNGRYRDYKFLQSMYYQIKTKISQNLPISSIDYVSKMSKLPDYEEEKRGIHISDILLLDRYSNIHSLTSEKIIQMENVDISLILEKQGNYFGYSAYPHIIVIKKFGSFPWIGIEFEGDIYEAISQIDYLNNAVSFSLFMESKEKTVENILNSENFKNVIHELMMEQNYLTILGPRVKFSELNNYKLLLHPMRLAIMDTLIKNFSMPRKDLEAVIEGNRGTFASHLTKLIDHKLLQSETQFIGREPLMVIYITNSGISYYEKFKNIIQGV